jgi:hypothetical protein
MSQLTQNPQAADLPKFVVEGEQHYGIHVSIDRFTGQVIDKQIEVVNDSFKEELTRLCTRLRRGRSAFAEASAFARGSGVTRRHDR